MSPFFIQSALFFKVVSCGFCDVAKVEYGLLLNAPRHVDDETTLRDACIVECFSTVTRSIDLAHRGRRATTNLARCAATNRTSALLARCAATNRTSALGAFVRPRRNYEIWRGCAATNRTARAQAEYVVTLARCGWGSYEVRRAIRNHPASCARCPSSSGIFRLAGPASTARSPRRHASRQMSPT